MNAKILIEHYELSSKDSIASVLEVNPEDFNCVSILEIPLSTRAGNCVRNNSVSSYSDLLKLSFSDIKQWRNCGRGTSVELLQNCASIAEKYEFGTTKAGQKINEIVEDLSAYCSSCQNEEDLIDVLESLLSIMPADYPKRSYFEAYLHDHYSSKSELKDAISGISFSETVREMRAPAFIHGFQFAHPALIIKGKYFDSQSLADLETISISDELDDLFVHNWLFFVNWANVDINLSIKTVFNRCNDERKNRVFFASANGKTLEEIGQDIGVTRERVRQILEKRVLRIRTELAESDFFYWLYSYFDEEKTIHVQEFRKILDEETNNALVYLMKRKSLDVESKWHYDVDFDTFVFDFAGQSDLSKIKPAIDALPNFITEKDMDFYILDIVDETKCGMDLIVREINKNFVQYSGFYSKKKFTFFDMCSYVLKEFFHDGFRPSDEEELELFRNKMEEVFDYDSSQWTSQSMHSAMYKVGTLCGRGTFRHASSFEVSDNGKKAIESIIFELFDSGRTALSFNELFSKLGDVTEKEGIEDSYVLHGVISNMELKYPMTQFYVLLEPTSSFENDFTDYVRRNYPISKKKVIQHFGLTGPQFLSVVDRCKHVKLVNNTLVYSAHK